MDVTGGVGCFELIQPKLETRPLVAKGEPQLGLDVGRAPELRAFAEKEHSALARSRQFSSVAAHREIFVDVDVHDHVGVFLGSRARPDLERSHGGVLPAERGGKPEP